MAWIKIDDQFADHPKIKAVGAIGQAIQVAAICYCGRYLTDGFLSYSVADAMIQSVIAPVTGLDETVRDDVDESTPPSSDTLGVTSTPPSSGRSANTRIYTLGFTCGMTGRDADEFFWPAIMVNAGLWEVVDGGYVVHDYLDYNPSKDEVLAHKEASRRGGKSSARLKTASRVTPTGTSTPPSSDTSRGTSTPPSSNPVPLPHKSTTHSLELLKTEKNSKTAMSNASRAPARGSGQVVDNSQRNGTAPTPGQRPNFSPELTEEIIDFLDELNGIFSLNDNDRIGIRSDIRQHGTTADLSYIPDQLRMAKADGRLGRSPGIANPVGWIRNQIQELTNDASPNYDPG